jgi:hypothetical protein
MGRAEIQVGHRLGGGFLHQELSLAPRTQALNLILAIGKQGIIHGRRNAGISRSELRRVVESDHA